MSRSGRSRTTTTTTARTRHAGSQVFRGMDVTPAAMEALPFVHSCPNLPCAKLRPGDDGKYAEHLLNAVATRISLANNPAGGPGARPHSMAACQAGAHEWSRPNGGHCTFCHAKYTEKPFECHEVRRPMKSDVECDAWFLGATERIRREEDAKMAEGGPPPGENQKEALERCEELVAGFGALGAADKLKQEHVECSAEWLAKLEVEVAIKRQKKNQTAKEDVGMPAFTRMHAKAVKEQLRKRLDAAQAKAARGAPSARKKTTAYPLLESCLICAGVTWLTRHEARRLVDLLCASLDVEYHEQGLEHNGEQDTPVAVLFRLCEAWDKVFYERPTDEHGVNTMLEGLTKVKYRICPVEGCLQPIDRVKPRGAKFAPGENMRHYKWLVKQRENQAKNRVALESAPGCNPEPDNQAKVAYLIGGSVTGRLNGRGCFVVEKVVNEGGCPKVEKPAHEEVARKVKAEGACLCNRTYSAPAVDDKGRPLIGPGSEIRRVGPGGAHFALAAHYPSADAHELGEDGKRPAVTLQAAQGENLVLELDHDNREDWDSTVWMRCCAFGHDAEEVKPPSEHDAEEVRDD